MDDSQSAAVQCAYCRQCCITTESGSVNRFLLVEPGGTVHFMISVICSEWQMSICIIKRASASDCGMARLAYFAAGVLRLRFPVWSRNLNDYDLALYVANGLLRALCTGRHC